MRACIERGEFSAALNPAAALHVLWVGMLGGAAIGLAQRLAPGEDPDALAHDLLNSLLAVSPRTSGRRSWRRNVRFIRRMSFLPRVHIVMRSYIHRSVAFFIRRPEGLRLPVVARPVLGIALIAVAAVVSACGGSSRLRPRRCPRRAAR